MSRLDKIKAVVARHYRLPRRIMEDRQQDHRASFARQVAMYLARRHTRFSYPQLGERFGGRDHTTVIFGCQRITRVRQEDPKLDRSIRKLEERL